MAFFPATIEMPTSRAFIKLGYAQGLFYQLRHVQPGFEIDFAVDASN